MKLRQFTALNNDVFTVTLITEDWSQNDVQLMEKFGEPQIDLGGTFTGTPSYTLPTNLKNIMTESPFVQGFDYRDFTTTTQARAALWATTMTTRIQAAVSTLRGNTDTFTGESVTTV